MSGKNMGKISFEPLMENLAYRFGNLRILEDALTHSSWANEAGANCANNERLEFLGDAVLELCISTELFLRFPDAREGDLTKMRARLVREGAIAEIARKLGIDQWLKLGVGEEKQGGRKRDSVLADAFEAVLAAVYEDGGFEAARDLVRRSYAGRWPEEWRERTTLDPKSRLQIIIQEHCRELPIYELVGQSGPEHERIFEVRLCLPDGREFRCKNTSCKKAEQACAALALESLKSS